jgi:hypothetical protein
VMWSARDNPSLILITSGLLNNLPGMSNHYSCQLLIANKGVWPHLHVF